MAMSNVWPRTVIFALDGGELRERRFNSQKEMEDYCQQQVVVRSIWEKVADVKHIQSVLIERIDRPDV